MKRSLITIIIAALTILPAYALTAEEYAKQATEKVEAKDYKGAVAAYTEAIKLDPKNADYYYQKAVVELTNLGEYKQAQVDIDTAISLDPKNAEYKSVKIISKEASAHPKAFNWFIKAKDEFDNKKYSESVAAINKAIELNPDFALYYAIRGFAKAYNNEDPAKVLADYDKAISIDKEGMKGEITDARNSVLEKWNSTVQEKVYSKKDYTGGLLDINKLIDVSPDYSEYYITRAFVFQNMQQYNNALSDIDKAISLAPEKAEYKGFRVLMEEGKAHPDAYQYFVSAQDKLYKKDYAGVVTDTTQAIKLSPAFGDYYVIRAIAKKQLKDYNGALSDMDKAASVDPGNKTKNFNRDGIITGIKKAMTQK